MQEKIGRYELRRELGRGGMGSVWVAYDDQLKREVAIKLLHQLDGSTRSTLHERFEREAQAIARLQHAHIIQVFDYGVTDTGRPYIVMEMLEGEDLSERLQRTKVLSLATFMPICTQVAKALDAAHAAGIVHRDLKPANIFLAKQGSETVAKILDFGVASIRSSLTDSKLDITGEQQLVGTPRYMSPEQARSSSVGPETDLWAFGIVIYEAVTGRPPFHADGLTGMLLKICMDPPKPPSSFATGLPAELDRFFEKALAKRPADRFGSAREMAAALAKFLDASAASKPIKILAVDDEPDIELMIRQRLRRKIRKKQYKFVFATDGAAALEKLEEHPDVEIALTDINMPGMDGLTFLQKVGDVAPTLKTIVASAYGDMANIRRAMNYGAFDFLTKPIDFKDLETTLEKGVREVRKLRAALRSMEENNVLRMLVDPSLMQRLLPLLRAEDSSGESGDATIVMIRITGELEDEPAAEILHHANDYFDCIVSILTHFEALVVGFVGRAVMVEFRGESHLLRAIEASMQIRRGVADIGNDDDDDDDADDADASLDVAIGLDSGRVVSGNVGSPSVQRLEYASMGEVVDTAMQLVWRAQAGQIVVSTAVMNALASDFDCEEVIATPPSEAGHLLLDKKLPDEVPPKLAKWMNQSDTVIAHKKRS